MARSRRGRSEDQIRPNPGREVGIPVLFFLVGVAGVILLWTTLARQEDDRFRLETRVTTEQVRFRFEAWIDDRVAIVEKLGREWLEEFEGHPEVYRREALRYFDLYPGMQALNWVDGGWVIRQITPEKPNRPALGKDLHQHPSPGVSAAVARAERKNSVTRTPVIDLLQGGVGFATYRPVRGDDGVLVGFVNGVFRVDTLVNACFREPGFRENFRFDLREPGGLVAYGSTDGSDPEEWTNRNEVLVRVVDRNWVLRVAPTPERLIAAKSMADELLAASGLLLITILASLLHIHLKRQRQLRESEAKYRLLVENQSDFIVRTDQDGKFLFASPSYCRTCGCSMEELMGRDFARFVHDEDREATNRMMASLDQPPHSAQSEHRAMTEDGYRWFAWSHNAVLDADGGVIAIVGVGRDITERRRLQEQLLQSQRMEAIGLLAGGIAHDFNNILQAIFGHLDLARRGVPADSKVAKHLAESKRSAGRAAALIRQLLAFTRQQVLNPRYLDLNRVVRDTLEMLRRVIGEDIDLDFESEPDIPTIHADPQQVGQILVNLCVNSRDAMPAGGRILLRTSVMEIGEDPPPPWDGTRPGRFVVLTVEDTGHGMDDEVASRVFEPFFTTKEPGRGTGLGLSTVYGIVKQHGGQIHVQSAPGSGTKFLVCFEAEEHPEEAMQPETIGRPTGGSETVLVAEDEEEVRRIARKLLERAGYRVLTAGDGPEAVSVFESREKGIDLLLLDVVMPGFGGQEVLRRIRRRDPEVRSLFTSGYSAAASEALGLLDAGVDLLPKPYDESELLRRIRLSLDGPA